MKSLKLLLTSLVLLSLGVSCSSKKASQPYSDGDDYVSANSENTPEALNDTVELDENGEEIVADNSVDAMATESSDIAEVENNASNDLSQDSENQDLAVADQPEIDSSVSSMDDGQGEIDYYQVEKHDTLMMIAFKIYGDIGKWKDLMALNDDKLKNGFPMAGQMLAYRKPSQAFEYSPSGNPYLVLHGDTLSLIAQKTYRKASWWVHIYENNQPLIKNPDEIYAGFTIYTPNEEDIQSRGVASKK